MQINCLLVLGKLLILILIEKKVLHVFMDVMGLNLQKDSFIIKILGIPQELLEKQEGLIPLKAVFQQLG